MTSHRTRRSHRRKGTKKARGISMKHIRRAKAAVSKAVSAAKAASKAASAAASAGKAMGAAAGKSMGMGKN